VEEENAMLLVSKEQIKEYTEKGYWGNETIVDLVYRNANDTPEEEAIVDPYNRKELMGTEAKRFTYAQFIQAADRLAIKFLELGIKKDDIIAVQLPNIVELIITYVAASRVGAIITPLGVQYRSHEVGYVLGLCEPVAYVTAITFNRFKYIEMVRKLTSNYPKLRSIIGIGEEIPDDIISFEEIVSTPFEKRYSKDYLEGRQSGPNEVFSICWTSGTEAEPKGVPRSHNHWRITGTHNPWLCELPSRCTILASFPLINMAGIGAAFMPWVVNAGKLVLHQPFDPVTYMQQITGEKVYYTMAPPAILVMLDRLAEWRELDKSSLKVLATGGSPLAPWISKRYRDAYGIAIVNEFAANEGFALLSSPIFFSDPEDRALYFPRWGSEGVEWKNLEKIRDEFARRVLMQSTQTKLVNPETGEMITERGIAGELRYKSPVVFAGYWKRPDLTAKVFDQEGYYCTGDLFSIEGEKMDKFLFKGRYKDLIIRGGQNISPVEIENLVGNHPKIHEVAAIGYPDERLGEKLCVVVVPKPGETITLEQIINYLKEKDIAVYKLPERLEIIDVMPRNAINKIEKNKLKKILWGK
jgi:non-ribosomal peptide synthetase component E (peptide arylation enzyme)